MNRLSIFVSPAGMILITLLLLAATIIPPADAQTSQKGTLSGRVFDADTREPLSFANVAVFRLAPGDSMGSPAGGTMTGEDGGYSLKLSPGLYRVVFSYVTYQPLTRTRIEVDPLITTALNAYLRSAAVEVQTVKVQAEAVRTAGGSMIAGLRKGATVADAVTSDEISRTSDGNAAEAVQRVTGVSVVGGKYVFVRGLGERYSATQVNGVGVGTPEPNRRVVPLDIFPTGVIDNMVVHKTFTPDMEGEFGGSVINISTKDFSGAPALRQSLGIGSSEGTTGAPFLTYDGGGLSLLGGPAASRSLPGQIERLAGDRRISPQNFTAEQLAEMGKAFDNVWTPRTETAAPNYSYSGVLSRGFSLFGRELGALVSAALSHGNSSLERTDNVYLGSLMETSPLREYDIRESTSSALAGLTGNLAYRLGDKDRLRLNLLYTRTSQDRTRVAQGPNYDRGTVQSITQLTLLQQSLGSVTLSGTHRAGVMGSTLDWSAGYSEASRDEPDRRTSNYEQREGSDVFTLGGTSNYPLTRIFGHSRDHDRSVKLDWTVPLAGGDAAEAKAKVGVARRTKDRSSEYRRFGYRRVGREQVDLTKPAELIVSDENLAKGIYRLEELTQNNDSYTADQTIHGAYGMVDLPVSSRVRVVAGGRFEEAVQHVDAESKFSVAAPATVVEQRDRGWLPSVSLAVKPRHNMNLRLAWSETLNRPELRELSPFQMYNYETGYSETGDTSLVTARLHNYDVRWEIFPYAGEFLALAGFYKRFDHPIQKIVVPTTGNYELRPINGNEATLYGWEAELRLSLRSVWKALDWMADLGRMPTALVGWSVVANHSRVTSEVLLPGGDGRAVAVPFIGQSPHSTNLGLFYSSLKGRLEGGLLYKSFGRRLDAYGASVLGDIYEHPPESLDLTLSYGLTRSARVKFSAENLLDRPTEYHQSGHITQSYNLGTTIGLAVTYQPPSQED